MKVPYWWLMWDVLPTLLLSPKFKSLCQVLIFLFTGKWTDVTYHARGIGLALFHFIHFFFVRRRYRALDGGRHVFIGFFRLDVLFTTKQDIFISLYCSTSARPGGFKTSTLVSGSERLGSSPGRGHRVVFLDKTLDSHTASLHPGPSCSKAGYR